jgi:4-hydroxy-3-polyprenylbenzoate decarboxylase
MMFTKMMIVVDGDVNIHDSAEVARYISENTDAGTDFLYTQGPTDVLDHSCSRMAFGGKMGLDATKKLPEEKLLDDPSKVLEAEVSAEEIKSRYPAIKAVNATLHRLGISLIFLTIEKQKKNHIREICNDLFELPSLKTTKVVIFLEHTLDVTDIADAVWRFANNFDPKRDHHTVMATSQGELNHVVFDGTRKTKAFDGFDRDWPNILASDESTIARIDEIWDHLGLGPFLKSPSLKYRPQLYEGGAVVKE